MLVDKNMHDKIGDQTKEKEPKKNTLDQLIKYLKRDLKNSSKKTDFSPELVRKIKKYKEKDPDFTFSY